MSEQPPNRVELERLARDGEETFAVGDLVEKYTGDYRLPGQVRVAFTTSAGKLKYAVEHWPGFLHIYSPSNLRRLQPGTTINWHGYALSPQQAQECIDNLQSQLESIRSRRMVECKMLQDRVEEARRILWELVLTRDTKQALGWTPSYWKREDVAYSDARAWLLHDKEEG